MHTGINFGVVICPLGNAPQPGKLGQQFVQGAAFTQYFQHARRLVCHQAASHFLPHPLGHQRISFAVLNHILHELHGLRRDAEVGKAGGKAGHTQNAHRVFAKGVGYMAQDSGLDVFLTAVGVD